MTNKRTILITGVTGQQGGAVAQALQGAGFYLRGMTRTPDSERAAALARHGIDIVKGDLDDEATLQNAFAGAWGVFGVQNAGEAGVEREEAQGKRLAALAREAGVEHYVYTSVGSAHKRTGVPHFDNKWRIEETVRGLSFPSHVILRPVFFMENLLAPFSLQGSQVAWTARWAARSRSFPTGHAATRGQMRAETREPMVDLTSHGVSFRVAARA